MEVVRDLTENPEVLWTFFSAQRRPGEEIEKQLGPGIDRGRVNLYAGVDCNQFFPRLFERWSTLQPTSPLPPIAQSNLVRVPDDFDEEVRKQREGPTIIEGDDEDRPPLVEICVGREPELRSIRYSNARVVFVTGMGGQGKSTVAAKYFADCQSGHEFSVYVWRDCKEERERFENQLSSVIERLSHGRVSGEDLARQSAASIIELLLSLIRDQKVLFTFDNADHYVDLEMGRMTGSPDLLVTALLESQCESRVVFTCRPEVQYAHPFTLSTRLEGISIDAAMQLFSERGATSTRAEIEEAHELTKGHAFWLDLLAVQVVKQNPPVSLHALIAQIGNDAELLPEKTLRSIWKTLAAPKQAVLRAMAETLKPETETAISDYLRGELTHNKVRKALKTLRSLNLVVIKKRPDGSDLLELHPLVRHFIRHNFPEKERLSYINRIISVYEKFIGAHRSRLKDRPSQVVLQYWTQSAELDIAAGRYADAFFTLAEVAEPFQGSAYPREYTRLARILFETVDWVSNHAEFKYFEGVFRFYVYSLCHLGEIAEVDGLLEKYEITVLSKDARYINYCNLRCYSKWARDDFTTAVKWGRKGQDLKVSSGVDTSYDISHNLALAERDSGRPEAALPTFLQGGSLAEVTHPEGLDGKRNGSYYGNVGRCLHLMGQVDGAIVCYQKSALLLEKARDQHIVNQGYIRQWIGELLVGRKQTNLAYIFLRAARLKWQQTSPPKALRVKLVETSLKKQLNDAPDIDDLAVERACLDWILGKNMDAVFGKE
jgi:tetratricopeptide (TPR) repeat protein